MRFELEQSDEILTPSSGLVFIGECLKNKMDLEHKLDNIKIPGRKFPQVKNHEVIFRGIKY